MQSMDGQGTRVLSKSSTMSATNGWTDKMNMVNHVQRSPAKNRSTHGYVSYGRARVRGGTGHTQASNRNASMTTSRVPCRPGEDSLRTEEDVTAKTVLARNSSMTLSNVDSAMNVREPAEANKTENSDKNTAIEFNGHNGICGAESSLNTALSSPIVAGELSVSGCIYNITSAEAPPGSLPCTPTTEMISDSDMVIVPGTERKHENGILKKLDFNETELRSPNETMESGSEEIVYGTPSFTGCRLKSVKEDAAEVAEDFSASANITKDDDGSKADSTFKVSSEPMKVPRNLQNHVKVKQVDSQSSGASDVPSISEMNITFEVDRATPVVNPNLLNSTYNAGLVAGKVADAKMVQPMEEVTAFIDADVASVPATPTLEVEPKEADDGPARKGKKQYDIPVNKNSTPTAPMEIVNSSDSEFEADPEPQTQRKKKSKPPAQKRDTRADIEALYEIENPIQSTSAALVRHEKRVAKQIQDGTLVEKKVSSRNERMAARNKNVSPVPVSPAPQQTRKKRIAKEETATAAKREFPANVNIEDLKSVKGDNCSEDGQEVEAMEEISIPTENGEVEAAAVKAQERKRPKTESKKGQTARGRPRKVANSERVKDLPLHDSIQSDEYVPGISRVAEDTIFESSASSETIKSDVRAADGNGNSQTTTEGENSQSEDMKVDEDKMCEAEEKDDEKKLVVTEMSDVCTTQCVQTEKETDSEFIDDKEEEQAPPELTPPPVQPSSKIRNNKRTKNTNKNPPQLVKEIEEQTVTPPVIKKEESSKEVNLKGATRSNEKQSRKRPAETSARNTKSRKKKAKEEEPELKSEPVIVPASRNKRTRKDSSQSVELVEVRKSPQLGRGRSKRTVPDIQEELDTSQELRRSKRMRKCKQFDIV